MTSKQIESKILKLQTIQSKLIKKCTKHHDRKQFERQRKLEIRISQLQTKITKLYKIHQTQLTWENHAKSGIQKP